MNARTLCAAVAGVLIVGLALTAGRQFAEKETANKYWSECTVHATENMELLSSAQDTNLAMVRTLAMQKQYIAQLEQALQQR